MAGPMIDQPERTPATFTPTVGETSPSARAFMTVARRRRSFGLDKLSSEPVTREQIEFVLETGRWAANHGNTEPWRFSVFSGQARTRLGDAFAEAYRQFTPNEAFKPLNQTAQRDKVWKAPVWIGLGVQFSGRLNIPDLEEIMAVACAAQNMMLAATGLGLASKWSSGLVNTHPSLAPLLGLKAPNRVLGFLYLGHPSVRWPDGKRNPLEQSVTWFE